eukprot:GGOE01014407.1.p1 GENE.GGOE01014407.1~~GGOE01014407.1.p1  ORF type:complete len:448 (-),score=129.55 GGOE01014407.1:264-1607(-)
MSGRLPTSLILPSPLQRAHAPTSLPVASHVSPPAFGVPTCPSLAAKRIQKEWDDLVEKGGMSQIPYCLRVTRQGEDLFRWVVSFGKSSSGADAAGQPLTLEVEFPRNYPFSAPHVTCRQFALFVPRFVPDWTPRMTVRTLLTAVMAKLEKVPFPANHVDLGRISPDEVSFDALGLSCINESSGKVVLLCSKPLDRNDRAYWTVTVHQCTEMDIGVSTLWEGHNLMQYVWSYLEVGVIQQLLLPEGSRSPEGRKEKLNSYEYAAEEVSAIPCEPFSAGDVIAVFYDGQQDRLSFFRNGTLQHTFANLYSPQEAPTPSLPVAASPGALPRPSASRRGRRERLINASADPLNAYGPIAPVVGRKGAARDTPSALLFPAVSLSSKLDSVSFAFEPPLWTPDTHQYFPRAFARMVPAVLFVLEKQYHLPRAAVVAILACVGTGFQMISIPTL